MTKNSNNNLVHIHYMITKNTHKDTKMNSLNTKKGDYLSEV